MPWNTRFHKEAGLGLLDRLLTPRAPEMMALWDATVAVARREHWYARHGVPDTVQGRFEMVTLVTALVMARLDGLGARRETAWLTERYVDDMDASLRELGVGDMLIAKRMGKVIGALGGRMDVYRAGLADREAMVAAVTRNVFEGSPPDADAAAGLADAVRDWGARLADAPLDALLAGRLP